jgi:hypothetical protein
MAASNHRPVLIVIAGPNGSGKTSVTSKILHHEWLEDSEYINPDNVARDVFGDWNNQESVLKAANYCNEWRERCLAERKSHIFETVMSAADKVDTFSERKKPDSSSVCSLFPPNLRQSTQSASLNEFWMADMMCQFLKSYPDTTSPLPIAKSCPR